MEKSHDLLWTEFDDALSKLVNEAKITLKAKRTSVQSVYNQLVVNESQTIQTERKAYEEGGKQDGEEIREG